MRDMSDIKQDAASVTDSCFSIYVRSSHLLVQDDGPEWRSKRQAEVEQLRQQLQHLQKLSSGV